MLASLQSVLALAALTLAAWGLGRALARWLGLAPQEGIESVTWSLALGLVAGGSAVAALGLLGVLYPEVIVGLTLLGICWGIVELAVAHLAARQPQVAAPGRVDPPHALCEPLAGPPQAILWFMALAAGSVVLVTFLAALAPPTAGDALYYHLALPKRWLAEHQLVFLPDHEKSTFPLLVEAWYAWALAIGDGATGALVHWLAGLLLAGASWSLARPVIGAAWAGVVAALVLLVPGVATQMTAPLNDLGLALSTTLALVAWRRALVERGGARWVLAAGLMLGAALATKYLALLYIVALATLTLVECRARPERRREALRAAMLAAAASAIVAAPWYARAAWHRGNPVYPFFAAWLGEPAVEALPEKKTPLGFDVVSLVTAPWQVTMHAERFGGRGHQLGIVFLALAPGLLIARPPKGLGTLLVMAAVYGGLWYALRQNVRFLLPIVPIGCLAAVWIVAQSFRYSSAPRAILGLAMAASVLLTPAAIVRANRERLAVAAGLVSRDKYLMAHEPSYPAAALLNSFAGSRACVLACDYRGFYFDGRYTWEKVYRLRRGNPWTDTATLDLSATLRAAGFTHLLLAESKADPTLFDAQLRELVERQLAAEQHAERPTLVPLHDYVRCDAEKTARRYRLFELR